MATTLGWLQSSSESEFENYWYTLGISAFLLYLVWIWLSPRIKVERARNYELLLLSYSAPLPILVVAFLGLKILHGLTEMPALYAIPLAYFAYEVFSALFLWRHNWKRRVNRGDVKETKSKSKIIVHNTPLRKSRFMTSGKSARPIEKLARFLLLVAAILFIVFMRDRALPIPEVLGDILISIGATAIFLRNPLRDVMALHFRERETGRSFEPLADPEEWALAELLSLK